MCSARLSTFMLVRGPKECVRLHLLNRTNTGTNLHFFQTEHSLSGNLWAVRIQYNLSQFFFALLVLLLILSWLVVVYQCSWWCDLNNKCYNNCVNNIVDWKQSRFSLMNEKEIDLQTFYLICESKTFFPAHLDHLSWAHTCSAGAWS